MNKIYNTLNRVWVAASVLVLLVVPTSVLFPHTNGKTLVWLIVVLVGIMGFALRKKQIKIPRSKIAYALYVWFGVMILASIAGIDLEKSMWGTDIRGFGLWVWAWLICYYTILTSLLQEEKTRKTYEIAVLGMSICASLIGILAQWYMGEHRVESVFGNPLLFANTMVFPAFFGAHIWARAKGWISWLGMVTALVCVYSIITTGSRGAFLGIIAGLILVILLQIREKISWKKTSIAVIAGVLFFCAGYIFKDTDLMRNLGVGRLFNISFSEASANQRTILWKISLEAFREKPLLGWGNENFDYAFDKHFDNRLVRYGFSQTWADRAHNVLFDALVMGGMGGFITLLMLWIVSTGTVIAESKQKKEYTWLAGMFVAYYIQSLFVFDGPASAVLYMGMLAYVSAQFSQHTIILKKSDRIIKVMLIACAVITAVMVYKAGTASSIMRRAEENSDPEDQLRLIDQSLASWSPHYNTLVQRAGNILFIAASPQDVELAEKQLSRGASIMERAIEKNPKRFSYQFTLGNILTKQTFIVDSDFGDQAEAVLKKSALLSPGRSAVWLQRANVKIAEGKYDEAVDIFNQIVEQFPLETQAQYALGVALLHTGKYELGLEKIAGSLVRYEPNSTEEINMVIRIALEHERYDVASHMFASSLVLDPYNEDNWYNLKVAIELPGADINAIIDKLQHIQEEDSSLSQRAQELLDYIHLKK